MDQQFKQCCVKGHEMNNATIICTLNDCSEENRWICPYCIFEQLHSHARADQSHLKKQQEFIDFIRMKSSQVSQVIEHQRLTQIFIKELQFFIRSSMNLITLLQQDLERVNQYNILEIKKILYVAQSNYLQLSCDQITKIVNINSIEQLSQCNLSQQKLEQLINIYQEQKVKLEQFHEHNQQQNSNQKQQSQAQENLISILNQFQNQTNNSQTKTYNYSNNQRKNLKIEQQVQLYDQNVPQDFQYSGHIQYESEFRISTYQVSPNEKYLAFGGYDMKINVYDIPSGKKIRCIKTSYIIEICQFTNDSKYLLAGDGEGFVYLYNIIDNFQEVQKSKIHLERICDLKIIDDLIVITCSTDKSIIVSNFKTNIQELQIKDAHHQSIQSVDYDKENQIIISSSSDQSIRFFDKANGQLVFVQQTVTSQLAKVQIYKIQLIENQKKLIGCSQQQILLWQVSYCQKLLIKIKEVNVKNYNFSSVLDGNNILLVCNNRILILDEKLNPQKLISHNISKFKCHFSSKQPNMMNYIVVAGEKNLNVLKRG